MDQKPPRKQFPLNKIVLCASFALAASFLLGSKEDKKKPPEPVLVPQSYTAFIDRVQNNQIKSIEIQDQVAYGEDQKGQRFSTLIPAGENLVERTIESGVEIVAKAPAPPPGQLLIFILNMAPIVLILVIMVSVLRSLGKKQNQFGKSTAKIMDEDIPSVTFDDVAGIESAKEDLEEIVDFLRDPTYAASLGGKSPTGALLVGPPGTGKTLIARAVAGEAKVPFFCCSGSDFVEMFVGVGASRVRDLFKTAKEAAPCIIFIDEIDAVGKNRGGGSGGGNDEREQTLNQILVEMDGFSADTGVVVLAATNRADVLDPALKRPGRFDRHIQVSLPDLEGRIKILGVHVKDKPLSRDVDLQVIARGTPGFSGADLANLANEAALLAARRRRQMIAPVDFEDAKDKILMGAENHTLRMSDEEVRITAYHEAGHAIIAALSPDSDPIHKATIIPRGGALGMVVRLPENDRVSVSRAKLKADLAVAYGGREAEHLIFGHEKVTTGASADIQWATGIAGRMVKEWGMSDKLSARRFASDDEESMLAQMGMQSRSISEALQNLVDTEIDSILKDAQMRARNTLTQNMEMFCQIAEALITYETLTGDEVRAMVHDGADIHALKKQSRLVEKQSRAQELPPADDNDPDE